MAIFPRIQSPCPVMARLDDYMDGDACRLCKRQVHDLSAMDDAARRSFFRDCSGEVCVSYRMPLRLVAAALAASTVASPAAAAPADPVVVSDAAPGTDDDFIVVMAGGIRDPRAVEFVSDGTADAELPELPVIEEPVRASPGDREG